MSGASSVNRIGSSETASACRDFSEKLDALLKDRHGAYVKIPQVLVFLDYINKVFPSFGFRLCDLYARDSRVIDMARDGVEESVAFNIYVARVSALGRGDLDIEAMKEEFKGVWKDILSAPVFDVHINEDQLFIRDIIFANESLDALSMLRNLTFPLDALKKNEKAKAFSGTLKQKLPGMENAV